MGNHLLLQAPVSLVLSVGQGMVPRFLGRGARAQLRPPLGARPPSLSWGCSWGAQGRPGFCLLVCAPNPRPALSAAGQTPEQ